MDLADDLEPDADWSRCPRCYSEVQAEYVLGLTLNSTVADSAAEFDCEYCGWHARPCLFTPAELAAIDLQRAQARLRRAEFPQWAARAIAGDLKHRHVPDDEIARLVNRMMTFRFDEVDCWVQSGLVDDQVTCTAHMYGWNPTTTTLRLDTVRSAARKAAGMTEQGWPNDPGPHVTPYVEHHVRTWVARLVGERIWTTSKVAEYLGIGAGRARALMVEWGIQPLSRAPGRRGENRYNSGEVKLQSQLRPGQGSRTDLAKAAEDEVSRPG